jgi:hypothetical protein
MIILAGANKFEGTPKNFEFVPSSEINTDGQEEVEDLIIRFELYPTPELVEVRFPRISKTIKESFVRLRMSKIKTSTVDLNNSNVILDGQIVGKSKTPDKKVQKPNGATVTILNK